MRKKLFITKSGIIALFFVLLSVFISFLTANGYRYPFVERITITSPVAFQVVQRNENNQSDIYVSGNYAGNPISIEASWNGSPFEIISQTPRGGAFSGILRNQLAGQGTLAVRFTDNKKVSSLVPFVGIGDIYVIAGQSNASGRGESNQIYTNSKIQASLFGNDDKWKKLQDPADSSIGQTDMISYEGTLAGGSIWPLLASLMAEDQKVPIAFVPVAKGLTTISEWQRSDLNPGDDNTLYGSMHRRINLVGKVKAVLFWQGESDAWKGTTENEYKNKIVKMADDIYDDFGVNTMVAQIGEVSSATPTNLNNIKNAQKSAWNESEYILPGPIFDNINLNDEVHFTTSEELKVAAERWWEAISGIFL